MPTVDPAQEVKDKLEASWATLHPGWTATLHVDESYRAEEDHPTVLVADDGGVAVNGGAWLLRKDLRRITLRLTAFAKGRGEARRTIDKTVDELVAGRPKKIARIDGVSDPLITRDPDTGNFLASVTMPVLVRPA